MELFEIEKYKDIAIRRMWWIIIPILVSILIGIGISLKVPKVYRANTLILVQRQKVPRDYVQGIVSIDLEDRIRTITHQVTSRSNLEKIIKDFNLFKEPGSPIFMEDKIINLRKRITVDVSKAGRGMNAFKIFFTGKNPKQVADIANAMTSYFMTENLKLREDQAIGTSDFLADELEIIRRKLVENEEILMRYQKRYTGELPEQLDANLRILERIQQQIVTNQENLRAAENRKLLIQQQISESAKMRSSFENLPEIVSFEEGDPAQDTTVDELKNKLASLEDRYTERHPDVVRLKEKIARMESVGKGDSGDIQVDQEVSKDMSTGLVESDLFLVPQLEQTELQIKNLKAEATKLKNQIIFYQNRVEKTPDREQELISLKRDYGNIKETYSSLLNRKLEAEIAVNLERKQKGEQFRVLDQAKVPMKPYKPNIQRMLLISIALGFALGFGLAYLRETMDTSFRRPEEIEALLQIPVLASLPFTYTAKEMRRRKRRKILTVVSVSLGFIFSGVGIVLYLKGIDATINFIKDIFKSL